jgi:hypothetical protein
MRLNFVLVATLALVFGCTIAHAQLKVLEGNEISLGTIYQTGEKIHKTITVKNIGKEKIKINHVGTSCGCTAAMISDTSLYPGSETEIEIEFDPLGSMGEVTKYIYISNSDPGDQLITVKMTGNIAYALQPIPGNAIFYNMKIGEVDSVSDTLRNESEESIEITKIEMPSSEITYKLDKKRLRPGEFTELHLYLKPKEERNISGFIQVFSTSKLQPVLQIRVFAGTILR